MDFHSYFRILFIYKLAVLVPDIQLSYFVYVVNYGSRNYKRGKAENIIDKVDDAESNFAF